MSKFSVILTIALVALLSLLSVRADDYNCPKSGNPVHAGCHVNVKFSGSACSSVQLEIKKRIDGQAAGSWSDPHNSGNYTLISESGNLWEMSRVTGDGKYTDKINFVYNDGSDSESCNVFACSQSQVFSIGDMGTNFCNIHDLYCKDAGCGAFTALDYSEDVGKCTENSPSKCTP